jgi:hypothetical protein
MKMFSVYINGTITHCYYSDSKSKIDMSTKIYSCNANGIGDEIIDIVDKTKFISAVRLYFEKNT